MTPSEPTMESGKSRRLVPILLFISLALNLLFLGLAGGHWYHHHNRTVVGDHENPGWAGGYGRGGRHGHERHEGRGFEHFMSAIPADQRDDIRSLMQAQREKAQKSFETMQSLRADVHKALVAEPFDKAKLGAAYAALRQQRAVLQESFQTNWIDIASKLPLETRQKLAEAHDRREGHGRH